MKSMKSLLLIFTLTYCIFTGPFIAAGSENKLSLEVPRIKTSQLVQLGQLRIDTMGLISFSGRKSGNQIIVQAMGSDGRLLGRAESVAGLDEIPIYVTSSFGLKKIILLWKDL